MNDNNIILSLEHISKSFGDQKVLNDVSVNIFRGHIISLLGANGSGKTTLVNIISGFLKADQGKVSYKNKNITNFPPHIINSLGISRTFQNLRLIKKLTVKENILLSFRNNKYENMWNVIFKPHSIKNYQIHYLDKLDDILKELFLSDLRDEKANNISYGQQKLLTLGCCIANDADLILLDEPVAGINPQYHELIKKVLLYLKKNGKTIFIIEHNTHFIDQISDKLLFLFDGKFLMFDTMNDLKNNDTVKNAYL